MQPENPYAAPLAPAVSPDAAIRREMRIASQGKRFLNLIIDNVIIQVISGMAGMAIGIVVGVSKAMNNDPITPEDEVGLQLAGMAVGLVITLGYFVVLEATFQRTFAKMITGTCVVAADGGRASFGQIVGRTFARLIPFEAFSFFGGKGYPVGWHDSLSGTRVISTR